jgi:hypothetical protein
MLENICMLKITNFKTSKFATDGFHKLYYQICYHTSQY